VSSENNNREIDVETNTGYVNTSIGRKSNNRRDRLGINQYLRSFRKNKKKKKKKKKKQENGRTAEFIHSSSRELEADSPAESHSRNAIELFRDHIGLCETSQLTATPACEPERKLSVATRTLRSTS